MFAQVKTLSDTDVRKSVALRKPRLRVKREGIASVSVNSSPHPLDKRVMPCAVPPSIG